jgi:hypothetical protein
MENIRSDHYRLGVEAHPQLCPAAAFDEHSEAI